MRDLLNQKIGKWTVIEHLGTNKSKDRLWLCKCECGLIKPVTAMSLIQGTSKQCIKCGQKPRPYKEELGEPFWKRIIKGAVKRNLSFNITKEQALQVFIKQNRKCALTGLDISLPKFDTDIRDGNVTASLDRIDGKKGYAIDNIQWVHKDVNRMKNIFSESYFKEICRLVTNKEEK